jgi:hypothetical protein
MKTTLHGTLQFDRSDRTVEGLRIPYSLESTNAVNFVLTQEPGKLKPKDLKVAIEKNRAERELRAEEQRKIREESGGAGGLDLRGILSEEKLNVSKSGSENAFNRQLREIAFLADVEEVEKQETEKEFRISEDYIGSTLLSDHDVQVVYKQRELLALYQKKQRWNTILSRNHTVSHAGHKNTAITAPAGTSNNSENNSEKKTSTSSSAAPIQLLKAGTSIDLMNHLVLTLKPQFDPNRNDIWSKRMNTLRKLVILTSKWIIRKRVEQRFLKLLFYFHENNAFSREEVKRFIVSENANARTTGGATAAKKDDTQKEKDKLLLTQGSSDATKTTTGSQKDALDTSIKTLNQFSFTEVFFTEMSAIKLRYEECQEMLLKHRLLMKSGQPEVTMNMLRRNLFPEFNQDLLSSSSSKANSTPKKPLSEYLKPITFNDYSYYHLKSKPDYITMNYQPFELPKMPLYFPLHCENQQRMTGFEESYQRTSANIGMRLSQYERIFQQNLSANGLSVDPLVNISEKSLQLLEEDIKKKEKPKRIIIPQSQYENLVHDIYKGNLEMNLLKRNKTIISELIGDDAIPPWLMITSNNPAIPLLKNNNEGQSQVSSPKKMKFNTTKGSGQPKLKIPTQLKMSWNRFELDFFSHFPQFRKFMPLLPFDESSNEWILRPRTSLQTSKENPWIYQKDTSLRTKWISEHLSGFLSCNYYLLGAAESCWRDSFIPPVGPTLNDYYFIDSDRHFSGLNCYKNDFQRDTNEWDGDIQFLQKKLAKEDYLTDSESDNEDEIDDAYRPSMKRVKKILKPSKKAAEATPAAAPATAKGAKGGKAPAAVAPVATATAVEEKEDEDLSEEVLNKKEEQVELLRDRKVLDLETTYKKSRQVLFQSMSKKLLEISQENNCILYTLPVPLAFHEYEFPVYQLMNSMLPELNNSLIEYDHHKRSTNALPTDTSLTLTNNFSPVKGFNKYNQFLPPHPTEQGQGQGQQKGEQNPNLSPRGKK